MSDSISLKFANKHVDSILSEEKRTTWRIDHHGVVKSGDLIALLDGDHNNFGIAEVIWCKNTRVSELSEEDMKYHESYNTTEEIIDALNEYYPDLDIVPATRVVVMRFKLREELME